MWDGWIDVAAASFLEILFALCGGGGRLVRYGRGEFPFTITVSGGGGGGSCGDRCEIGVINDAISHASSGGSGNLNSVTHPATSSGIPPTLRAVPLPVEVLQATSTLAGEAEGDQPTTVATNLAD